VWQILHGSIKIDEGPLTPTYIIPGRFHVGYSILGRWLMRRGGDQRQASARFIVSLAGIVLTLVLAQYLAWALLGSKILADPGGREALWFWYGQLGVGVAFYLACLLGYQPTIDISVSDRAVSIRRGRESIRLSYDDVVRVTEISALDFYRHYAKYQRTRSFVNRLADTVLLIHMTDGDVVLGLQQPGRAALMARITTHISAPVSRPATVQVA